MKKRSVNFANEADARFRELEGINIETIAEPSHKKGKLVRAKVASMGTGAYKKKGGKKC
jgi:hypothetical protein